MFGLTAGATSSFHYNLDEVTEASTWNPNAKSGKEFGGMHYSSVLYATEHIEKDMKTNNDIKESVEDIIKNIRDR